MANKQLDQAITDNEKLQDDVLAKTQKLKDAMKMVEEARGERDALQAEVAQLKSGKMSELHFSAAFQKEFEKRGEFQAKYHEVLDRCAVSSCFVHHNYTSHAPKHMP